MDFIIILLEILLYIILCSSVIGSFIDIYVIFIKGVPILFKWTQEFFKEIDDFKLFLDKRRKK